MPKVALLVGIKVHKHSIKKMLVSYISLFVVWYRLCLLRTAGRSINLGVQSIGDPLALLTNKYLLIIDALPLFIFQDFPCNIEKNLAMERTGESNISGIYLIYLLPGLVYTIAVTGFLCQNYSTAKLVIRYEF